MTADEASGYRSYTGSDAGRSLMSEVQGQKNIIAAKNKATTVNP